MNNVCTVSLSTPVLFLVFNRPATTRRVFEQIKKVRPLKLFIAADGPRDNEEALLCAQVKDIVTHINWDCQVYTLFRDHNLGCGRAISSAITWFFEHVEDGIILEDDCVPDPTFFVYCQQLLDKYKYDSRVMMVAGTSYLFNQVTHRESYFFAKYYSVWGWATWRRAWLLYDFELAGWNRECGAPYLVNFFRDQVRADFWANYFDRIVHKKIDTWDIQFSYMCIFNGGLSVVPVHNLISNIGYDGAHANGKKSPYHEIPLVQLTTLVHPCAVYYNKKLDRKIYQNIGVLPRWSFKRVVKRMVPSVVQPFAKFVLHSVTKFFRQKY
jgi:hypothetical protein